MRGSHEVTVTVLRGVRDAMRRKAKASEMTMEEWTSIVVAGAPEKLKRPAGWVKPRRGGRRGKVCEEQAAASGDEAVAPVVAAKVLGRAVKAGRRPAVGHPAAAVDSAEGDVPSPGAKVGAVPGDRVLDSKSMVAGSTPAAVAKVMGSGPCPGEARAASSDGQTNSLSAANVAAGPTSFECPSCYRAVPDKGYRGRRHQLACPKYSRAQ